MHERAFIVLPCLYGERGEDDPLTDDPSTHPHHQQLFPLHASPAAAAHKHQQQRGGAGGAAGGAPPTHILGILREVPSYSYDVRHPPNQDYPPPSEITPVGAQHANAHAHGWQQGQGQRQPNLGYAVYHPPPQQQGPGQY